MMGSFVALITPFLNDGQVDYNALKRLVAWHIEEGTHGFVILGTTAESPTLSDNERTQIIKTVIAESSIPVWVGVGTHATQQSIQYAKEAEVLGADGVMAVCPYYNKPTQEGLYLHFKSIHDAITIPLMLYNVPGRTVVDLSFNTIEKLHMLPRVVALKDATGDLHRLQDYRRLTQLSILSGDDGTTGEFLIQGGHGMVSVTANIMPKHCSRLFQAAALGQFDQVVSIQQDLEQLNQFLFIESNPIPVKWLMAEMGLIGHHVRLPLTSLAEQYHQQAKNLLNTYA
ncbi:MAG: 4-hydroxy-tetrahydrodipicolinate synthase [Candidatus Comchoanobacterales bacterium]